LRALPALGSGLARVTPLARAWKNSVSVGAGRGETLPVGLSAKTNRLIMRVVSRLIPRFKNAAPRVDVSWESRDPGVVLSTLDDTTSPRFNAAIELAGDGDVRAPWHLIVLVGPDFGEIFALKSPSRSLLGRGSGTEVTLEDSQVSRRQAILIVDDELGLTIHDQGSSNGTRVNGRLVDGARALKDGDRIRVGESTLKVMGPSNSEVGYHESMYRLVTVDDLTGAQTRRFLMNHLRRRMERPPEALSVLILDVDHFKHVNDEYGHPVGDRVLVKLVDRIRGGIRPEMVLARYGGEEFVLVAPMPLSGAVRVAQALLELVAASPLVADPEVWLTISLGVADLTDVPSLAVGHGQEPEPMACVRDLIAAADARLLIAKERGRNQLCANGGDSSSPPSTVPSSSSLGRESDSD
jgi:two-component system, cell cycle response regulator